MGGHVQRCGCYDGPFSEENEKLVSIRCEQHREEPAKEGHAVLFRCEQRGCQEFAEGSFIDIERGPILLCGRHGRRLQRSMAALIAAFDAKPVTLHSKVRRVTGQAQPQRRPKRARAERQSRNERCIHCGDKLKRCVCPYPIEQKRSPRVRRAEGS